MTPSADASPPNKQPTSEASKAPTFGYLLIDHDQQHGYTGGLLVVCERGRPLEFHCTEPVSTSRAQEILFGPTLRAYVCGEQIGGALLAKTKLPLTALLVSDDDSALAGRQAGIPTLLVHGDQVGVAEEPQVAGAVARLAEAIDPVEPFQRVAEAIREAQRLGSGGPARDAA